MAVQFPGHAKADSRTPQGHELARSQDEVDAGTASTQTQSTIPSLDTEKKGDETERSDSGGEDVAVAAGEIAADEDYPTGFKLLVIVVALIISMFLVALDTVRIISPELFEILANPQDYRRDRDPQNHGPIPWT